MKKFITIIMLILLTLTLMGCKSYEEYIPLEEDYGTWDGYYIYYGNVRCKTTGEDEQILVDEIYYNNQNYKIDSLIKYEYIDTNIYMVICFKNENEQYITSFLKYSIANKTTDVIYTEEDDFICSFFIKENRYVFLQLRKFDDNYISIDYYIRYDLETNTHVSFIDYSLDTVLDDIILFKKDGITYYTKYDEFDFIEIGRLENGYSRLVTVNNKRYLLHTSSQFVSAYVFHKTLSIYDFESKKLNHIITYSDCKEFEIINDEYIIFYETKSYEYVSSIKNVNSLKYEMLDHYIGVNNVLSKINYDEMSINDVYTFKERDVSYTYGYIEDDKYYIVAEKVIKGSQIIPGKVKTSKYILNLNTLELSRNLKYNKETNKKTRDEIVVDNYVYYFESKSVVPIMGNNYVSFLYREDLSTKEVKVMQYFGHVMGEVKGTRYSSLFVNAYVEEKKFEDILIIDK